MNSATIPLAALATFATVYWLTPGPAVVPAPEPAAIVETPAAAALPAAAAPRTPARKRPRSRTARPHRAVAAAARAPARRAPEVHFAGCKAVRAAGLAPLYRGQPGYRAEMDGDDDGIACEPYRGRR